MNQSILTAKSGVLSQQTRLDVIGSNVANVNTIGYKSARTDFKDALYQQLKRPVRSEEDLDVQRGHGVLVDATGRNYATGSLSQTGNMLDFMIVGEGFFTVRDANGQTAYTRNGQFTVSVEEEGMFLVNAQGLYVLGADGNRIELPKSGQISADGQGNLTYAEQQLDENGNALPQTAFAKLGLVTFPNANGLQAQGNSTFLATAASGEPAAMGEESLVRQGALEMSNVDMGTEMTRLIRTQRAFQLASRAISTADDMMGIANNIRRG